MTNPPPIPVSHLTVPQAARYLGVTRAAVRKRLTYQNVGTLDSVEVLGIPMIPSWQVRRALRRAQKRAERLVRREA